MENLPRGIRNNNPLNIRISLIAWIGKVKNNTDGAFEQFTSLEYGLRAAFINIQTIVRRRSRCGEYTTLAQLIHIWAPSSDGNNEIAYVAAVAKHSGIKSNDHIIIQNKTQMCALVAAMCKVECGQEVSSLRIDSAYNLAFLRAGVRTLFDQPAD